MKLKLAIAFFLFTGISATAQQVENDVNRYEIGAQWRSNGLGLTFQKFFGLSTPKKIELKYGASVNTLKHSKEIKLLNQSYERSKPYVYGRLNRLGTVNFYTGINHALAKGDYRGKPGINNSLVVGFSLGVLRPVYLDISHDQRDGKYYIRSERYDPSIHTNQNQIVGESRGTAGWNELTFVPGINLKYASQFVWINASGTTQALELGMDYPG